MPLRCSRAIALHDTTAFFTRAFEIQWFTSFWKRRSQPAFLRRRRLASRVIADTGFFHRGATKRLAFAICGKVYDAQINAQRPAVRFARIWRFAALGDMQIVDATPP